MRRLTNWLAVFALALLTEANAELYKSVDEHGNVTYTDQGSEKAKQVEPPGLTSYKPPAQHTQPAGQDQTTAPQKATTAYSALSIANPKQDETVRENSGTVVIRANVSPALDVAAGHKLIVVLDGKTAAEAQAAEVTLQNLDRGTHSIVVRIVDGSNRVMKESGAVAFHMHRQAVGGRKSGK